MSLSVYEPLRNEQKLLLDVVEGGLIPKQTVGELKKLVAARKAAEANLVENDLRRMRLEKENRYNAFLELQRRQSDVEMGRAMGLRDPGLDARPRELKYQMSTQSAAPTELAIPGSPPRDEQHPSLVHRANLHLSEGELRRMRNLMFPQDFVVPRARPQPVFTLLPPTPLALPAPTTPPAAPLQKLLPRLQNQKTPQS